MLRTGIEAIRDKSQVIPQEWLIPRGKMPFTEVEGVTIFLAKDYELSKLGMIPKVRGAEYDYESALHNIYNPTQVVDAMKRAEAFAASKDQLSAAYYEVFLRNLKGEPELDLVHLISGVNKNTGDPYLMFGHFPRPLNPEPERVKSIYVEKRKNIF